MYIHIYTLIYIYTYTYTHAHIYSHIHTLTHTHNHTHKNTHIHIYKAVCNLFRGFPHPDPASHHIATCQLNCKKSQITGLRKMRETRSGNPRTESRNKSQKK